MRIHATLFASAALVCLGSAACATAGPQDPTTLTLRRPDGATAVCTRPPASWLDSQNGVAVAAALPNLVESLLSSSGAHSAAVAAPAAGGEPGGGAPGAGPPGGGPPPKGAGGAAAPQSGNLLDAVIRVAPTPHSLDVLDYRLCLEYGKGVLSRDVYIYWLLDLRPRAFDAVPPEKNVP